MKDEPPTGPASRSVDVAVTVAGAPTATSVARWARSLLGRRPAALSVLLCGDARMRRLNREFRGVDRATDVLAFPSGERVFLGDLVLDVPYASRQARRLGHAPERELKILLAHGILHLLGHDHETDDGTMFRLQRRLVTRVFGPGPDGVPAEEGT